MSKSKLILASGSPRRKALLESMGLDCVVQPADIDESRLPDESPKQYVYRMAESKAQFIYQNSIKLAENSKPAKIIAVIAADTIVCQKDVIFGKPSDRDHAFSIWRQLSDGKHQVLTGVCLINSDQDQVSQSQITICETDVLFNKITEDQMQRYWATGEPQDKAGGYAIQGFASAWVKQISGSYSNVVGLPLYEVNTMLKTVNLNWL